MKKIILLFLTTLCLAGCRKTDQAEKFYLSAAKAYNAKDFKNALDMLEKSIKCDRYYLKSRFLKGKTLFFEKDYMNAETEFLWLTSKQKANVDFKLWLLRTYIFGEKKEQASELVQNLLKENSSDWRVYYWKAQLSKSSGDFETYFFCLNRADMYLKESSAVYLDLARTWLEVGLSDKSALYYAKAQSLNK